MHLIQNKPTVLVVGAFGARLGRVWTVSLVLMQNGRNRSQHDPRSIGAFRYRIHAATALRCSQRLCQGLHRLGRSPWR
jgi:hypothetical protein